MTRPPFARTALDDLLLRPTPLLRLNGLLVKLESIRPTGGFQDRALGLWDDLLAQQDPLPVRWVAPASNGAALAAAAWASARRLQLSLVLQRPAPHEVLETISLWSIPHECAEGSIAAVDRAAALARDTDAFLLPSLDGETAVPHYERTLGQELVRDLAAAEPKPTLLVGPVGALAALRGVSLALKIPRVVVVCAATPADALPDLDFASDGAKANARANAMATQISPPHFSFSPLSRSSASSARLRLALAHGLLLSHASAAAIEVAEHLGAVGGPVLVLAVANGEREFSLDPTSHSTSPR